MPSPSMLTRGQQLAAEAAEAAEVRDALTHPDVVALRVERVRARVDRFIWTGMVLGLLFTMTTVQQFTADTMHSGPGSLGWWAAWLLDPTVSVILLGVLLAEREASRWQEPMDAWARVAKWGLLGATYVMNTWQSYAEGNLAGIVLHTVPVLAVFTGAEAVTSCNNALTRAAEAALAKAAERADRKAKVERDTTERDHPAEQSPVVPVPAPVPIAPAVGAPFRVVANRPDPAPAERLTDRPAERSADRSEPPAPTGPVGRPEAPRRSGPARSRSRKPRTDAQLSRQVRELAEQNGEPPTQYAIKQRFGVGSGRAARLLADLDTSSAGPAEGNGAATRKDGAR